MFIFNLCYYLIKNCKVDRNVRVLTMDTSPTVLAIDIINAMIIINELFTIEIAQCLY